MLLSLAISAFLISVPLQEEIDPIPSILASIDPARLFQDVETLVGFHTRHTLSDTESDERGIGAARRWLRSEFESISAATGGRLLVREQRATVTIIGREVELVNVYGFLPGTQGNPLGRTYIVSGHYDSRAGRGMDAESFAPGADDDASGTAVVLELARVMAGRQYSANLVFLCVPGEEQGLYGAKEFARQAQEDGLAIDGMITNDIVGGVEGGNGIRDDRTVRCFSSASKSSRAPEDASQIGDGVHSLSRELARALAASAARYVDDATVKLVFRLDRFGRGGDHIPFHDLGLPALRLSEANEHYARQHKDVEEKDGVRYGDLSEFVSGDYMARVARVNAACLAELALAPEPPSGIRMRAAVSYDTQLSWTPSSGEVAGYEVVWRDTTAPQWEHVQRVGPETSTMTARGNQREVVRATVEGVTADTCFFGVRAVSPSGHRSRVAYPGRP